MNNTIISKWHPIIQKLDATNSLTEEQQFALCNYCEDFSKHVSMLENNEYFTSRISKNETDLLNLNRLYIPKGCALLPILLKIMYGVMIELNKVNIQLTFSDEPEPEAELKFENGAPIFTTTSTFEAKYTSIEIKDELDGYLKGFGIDVFKKSESSLIEFTIYNLVELGKQNGELCLHVTGNSLDIITCPGLKKRMTLRYKIKNIQK